MYNIKWALNFSKADKYKISQVIFLATVSFVNTEQLPSMRAGLPKWLFRKAYKVKHTHTDTHSLTVT